MKTKKIREKQCRVCGFRFIPRATTQIVCGHICAITLNQRRKAKEFDAETRRLKKTIKTRGDYTAEAQTSINRYVRARDSKNGCISCGRGGGCQFHAGHYISIGKNCSLRFFLKNIHKQCAQCNKWRGSNAIPYRIALIKKIGLLGVEWLEGPHDAKNYAIDDLIRIKKIFDKKFKRIKI